MSRLVTLDFETYYSKDYGLKKLTTEAYIRDPQFEVIGVAVKVDNYPTDWFSGTKKEIKEWLSVIPWEETNLVCHHTAFDGAILAWHFGIRPRYYMDTLSMSRPLHGLNVGGSLAALAKHYGIGAKGTEVLDALGKKRVDFEPGELLKYGDYCKNDTELTYTLFNLLKPEIPNKEMYMIDLMLRMFIDPVLELDAGKLDTHLINVQKKKEILMNRIDSTIGRDALMSNPQFAEVLKKMGVEPPTKISLRTGKEAYAFGKTDPEFKKLLDHEDERVQAVVSARLGVKSTLEETRTQSFIGIAERGALPILLNYYGAHTGRASGGDKINLQNLPRGGELRKSMRAPEKHKLVASDSAQIEARVVAWFAGEEALVEAFRNKVDIYSEFASTVYEKEVTKDSDPLARHVGKTAVLGLGYSMGKDKFKVTLKAGNPSVDMPLSDAERVVNLYRQKYPNIVALWKQGQEALDAMIKGFEYDLGVGVKLKCKDNKIYLPNGMFINYPNLRKSGNEYLYDARYGANKIYGGKVIENVVQALARIIVFDQMAKIDQKFRKKDSKTNRFKVVLTVHDEVVACVPEQAVGKCVEFMEQVMSVPPPWCSDLPIACEAAYGNSYGDCK
ncbi:PolA DNA polymerase I - 3'-5' exonuclease and polymerase domains [uncultured Caudovirales phage]|uniref:PolA DNA polymerase I - 3'-5' exonuclease and polymerase domains n=1 Tax=uncultured Caudovirales phage TaxID=2100421 RepID=A0A6J5LMV9_9CAUD|nr:PolA DNA polymerase I - 3'-5' exonuclease and polymerase domains [uncultured Caudovirales phage]